jgi:hypothetical protein
MVKAAKLCQNSRILAGATSSACSKKHCPVAVNPVFTLARDLATISGWLSYSFEMIWQVTSGGVQKLSQTGIVSTHQGGSDDTPLE